MFAFIFCMENIMYICLNFSVVAVRLLRGVNHITFKEVVYEDMSKNLILEKNVLIFFHIN